MSLLSLCTGISLLVSALRLVEATGKAGAPQHEASQSCRAGGRSAICDSLVEDWNMKSPCFPVQEAVAPTCPQIPALLLISCSWRALPVPAQFISAQMKVLEAVGIFKPGH